MTYSEVQQLASGPLGTYALHTLGWFCLLGAFLLAGASPGGASPSVTPGTPAVPGASLHD